MMLVRNKCTNCKHKWRDQPGAFAVKKVLIGYHEDGSPKYSLQCPQCGSLYFKWSSFEFDKKKYASEFDFGNY